MVGHKICFNGEMLLIIPVTPSYLEHWLYMYHGLSAWTGENPMSFIRYLLMLMEGLHAHGGSSLFRWKIHGITVTNIHP